MLELLGYYGAVKRGIDMFDCVLPTRSGRTGLAYVGWKNQYKKQQHQTDNSPLDPNLPIKSK